MYNTIDKFCFDIELIKHFYRTQLLCPSIYTYILTIGCIDCLLLSTVTNIFPNTVIHSTDLLTILNKLPLSLSTTLTFTRNCISAVSYAYTLFTVVDAKNENIRRKKKRKKDRESKNQKNYHHNKIKFFPPYCYYCSCWKPFSGAALKVFNSLGIRHKKLLKHFEMCNASFVPLCVAECVPVRQHFK